MSVLVLVECIHVVVSMWGMVAMETLGYCPYLCDWDAPV